MSFEKENKILKAAVINTDELVKSQSRDVGDARMTESKEDRSANLLTRTLKRMWKHNLAQEWYRQREIGRARKEILETNNLYAGEKEFDPDQVSAKKASDDASKEAMQAIIDRFTSDYGDEVLKEEEADSKQVIEGQAINQKLKELIKLYADTEMGDEAFKQEKNRILSVYDKKYADPKSMYADNLLTIAKEVQDVVRQGTKLAELDFEVELTLGDARESLSTHANQSDFDKKIEKLQGTKVGKWVANDAVALGITAGLYEVGRKTLQKTVRSKAAQLATFGLASVAAGGISAARENTRIKRERLQHQRESAKGMQFNEKDMKRRQEMELNSYDTKKATIIIQNLNEDLDKVKQDQVPSEQEILAIIGRLADLEARIELNDQENIDLITYDKFTKIERDRTTMDLKRAELKVALRNLEREDNALDFDIELEHMTEVQKEQLEGGIDEKNEVFETLRKRKVKWAFINGTIAAATIGTAVQEIGAFANDSQDGVLEGAFGNKDHLVAHGTTLEALRRYITGDHAPDLTGPLHAETFAGSPTHVAMPDGVTFEPNNDAEATYNLMRDGKVIADHVHVNFDEHGDLAVETKKELMEAGITTGQLANVVDKTSETIHESISDYVKNHAEGMKRIHRELWYDNDTPHPFDKNELRTDWGGEHNTGIDAKGNYVFNVSRMTSDGSVHGTQSIDPTKGGLKMIFSFSKDTQHQVFEVPIGPDGNAVIDPNTPLGKLMFEKSIDGHAVFTGKFAEVAQVTGTAADGGETVRILGTHIGAGKDSLDVVVGTDTTTPQVTLGIPNENTYDVPPVIPVMARRPLERGTYKTNREVEASRPRERNESQSEVSNTPEVAPPAGGEPIPQGSFRADIAEKMQYSQGRGFEGKEEPIGKDTDHIYAMGFATIDRKSIEAQLTKDKNKYKHPEVLLLEHDRTDREANLKQFEYLKKWYPKVKFTYVALPETILNVPQTVEKREVYNKERLTHILKESNIDTKKIKNEFIRPEKITAPKLLREISEKEWDKYITTGKVSKARLQSIAEKLKNNPVIGSALDGKERQIYEEYKEEVQKLSK